MRSLASTIAAELLSADPFGTTERLRLTEPVAWAPLMNRWLVSRRDLVLEVLTDVERFTTDDDRSPIKATFGVQMLSTDGPEQRRQRDPFQARFRPAELQAEVAGAINARAAALVGSLSPGDDLTMSASVMAIETVLEVVGLLDGVDVATVRAWYDDLASALANVEGDTDVAERGKAAAEQVTQLVRTLGRGDDAANTLLILFGGIETTQSAILNALWSLATDLDAQQHVRRDRTKTANAFEESLRWQPAVLTLTRFTTQTARLAGAEIPAGSIVECLIAGANRDPLAFDDPDRFDVARPNANQHLTFGFGRHHCLGAHLARMEAIAFIEAFLDRTGDGFDFASKHPPPPVGHEFRRPPSLRLSW